MSKTIVYQYNGMSRLYGYPTHDGQWKQFTVTTGAKMLGHTLFRTNFGWPYDIPQYVIYCIPYSCLLKDPETFKKFTRIRSKNSLRNKYDYFNLNDLEPLFFDKNKLKINDDKISLNAGKPITEIIAEQKLLAEERRKAEQAVRKDAFKIYHDKYRFSTSAYYDTTSTTVDGT
jgi:hypothetical protein